jgi:putative cell wall-binding protein
VTTVTRLGGANRYETSEIIAGEVKRILGTNYDGSAFVATANTFPDALAAAPLSYAGCWPILLARTSGLPDGMTDVQRVAILGGPNAVTPEVETALSDSLGAANVTRVEGATRYETAIEIAYWGVENAGLTWSHTAIATGENFPDALAGGPLQGRYRSVMLLTPTSAAHDGVLQTVWDQQDGIGEVRFIGGTSAVSDDVRTAVMARTVDPM